LENENHEQEIDLLELIKMVLSRWYIIVASVVVVMSLTAIYAYGMQDDYYTTRASIMVNVREEQQWDAGDLQLAQRLIDTYTDVAESSTVLNVLRDELDLPYSNSGLRNMINVSRGRPDSIVIFFEVESNDRDEAVAMANSLIGIIQEMSIENDSLHSVEQLDVAERPNNPSGPNRVLYMAIGFVLGGMIGVFGVFTIEFLDKTIKSTKDIENKLGLRSLGTIPEYEMEEEVAE